jgi:hypothetical protein
MFQLLLPDRPQDSETVVSMFALWGLSQLLLAGFQGVILLKYRGLLPLGYVSLALDLVGRSRIGRTKPITTVIRPPGARANAMWRAACVAMLLWLGWHNLGGLGRGAKRKEKETLSNRR